MKRVNVVMSTYNGEKFVKEQLESLLNQNYDKICIYIHDDNSTDGTVNIIKKIIKENKTNKKIIIHSIGSQGYPSCFINLLLDIPKADYYMFCDQDDVWNEDKIKTAVDAMDKYSDENVPTLFYSCVDYYDQDLQFIRPARFIEKGSLSIKKYNIQQLLFGGEAMGMTFLFNNKVRDVFAELKENGATDFKDTFIKIYCAACGGVLYSMTPCAKYRRHKNATTFGMNPSAKGKHILNMAKKIFFEPDGLASIQNSVDYIYKNYFDRVLPEAKILIELFAKPNTLKKRYKKIFWTQRFRINFMDEFGYRVAFFLGRI